RHNRPAARPRQAEALAGEGQSGKSRLLADMVGRELIERDAVAKPGPQLRVRGGSEEAENRIVARTDLRMRQPGDDSEVVAKLLHDVKVRRERVVLAGLFRKEIGSVQPERGADTNHAARRGGSRAAGGQCPGRSHRIETWQSQRHASRPQEI